MTRRARRRRRRETAGEAVVACDAIATVAREYWAGDMLGALGDLAEDLRARAAAFERLRDELAQFASDRRVPLNADTLATFAASAPERGRLVAATVEGVG